MKNISTLIIGLLFAILNLNAQNICPTAVTITTGNHSVSSIIPGGPPPVPNCAANFGGATGAAWFKYQASVDGLATVSSDFGSNSGLDTRLTVYTGTCGTLVCIEGNDDIDGTTNELSEASFPVTNGTDYFIVWDNTYSSLGFDFSLSETAFNCSAISLPINEDFDDINTYVACLTTESVDANVTDFELRFFDWNGDGTDEDYVNNGSTSTIAKDDWLFSTPVNLTSGHEYSVTFKYNGADGTNPSNEDLDVYFLDGPSSAANTLTSLFSDTGIIKNGSNSQAESMAIPQSINYTSTATGTYYLAFNATSSANTGSLLLFEYSITDNTLGVSDFSLEGISKSYNNQSDVLTLNSSNLVLNGLKIYNILGQEVYNKSLSKQVERINLSRLFDGIYILRVSSAEGTYTTKLLKQ